MDEFRRLEIERLATGIPGLDEVLGGGLPEYSFNLIAGDPGSGKTTLATQIMFANATPERPALHFTVLGEPPFKMIRYQQQFDFFDPSKVTREVQYLNLSDAVLAGDLGTVLDSITREVENQRPRIVVVDSFRTIVRTLSEQSGGEAELQNFIQRLALKLATWEVTSFLVGEYRLIDQGSNPVFTVADGIHWLIQSVERNSVVRKLQVLKLRGQAPMPGLHTYRITREGLRVFPRIHSRVPGPPHRRAERRLSTGVHELDRMLGGGVPEGHALVIAGPTGTGKSTFARQFLAAGAEADEASVLAVFEEHPQDYVEQARRIGIDLDAREREDKLEILYLRPLDLSVDETLEAIRASVERIGASRVVIDSLSGFEVALAPTFREDFRESLYRLVTSLTGIGVTVVMTVESPVGDPEGWTTGYALSFLTDDIIKLQRIEEEDSMRLVLAVIKVRGSRHSMRLRNFEVTPTGIELLPQDEGRDGPAGPDGSM